MSETDVLLVHDGDGESTGRLRARLLEAFAVAGVAPAWRERPADAEDVPPQVAAGPLPAVVVGGEPVEAGTCCNGIPSVQALVRALSAAAPAGAPRSRWAVLAAALPGVGVALLPKVVCPFCWPAYAAILSALGLSFLMERTYLLPLTFGALTLVLGVLAWGARRSGRWWPLGIGTAGAALVLAFKFLWDVPAVTYAGAALLFAACVLHTLRPRTKVRACPSCPPAGGRASA